MPRGRPVQLVESVPISMFPRSGYGRTFVYAVAFKGGVVKVGISKTPRSRIRDHWKRGAGEVEWVHLFAPMHRRTAKLAEQSAVEKLKGIGDQVNHSEWFMCQADRQAVITVIRKCIEDSRRHMQNLFAEQAALQAKKSRVAEALRDAGFEDEADWYSSYRY